MSKVIYCFKIFLLRDELDLPPETIVGIKEMCNFFFAIIYVKAWILAPITSEAAVNDLKLLNQLEDFRCINGEIVNAAKTKIQNHLWYLGEELIAFAFFSNQISPKEKFAMQKSLQRKPSVAGRQLKWKPSGSIKKIKLADLINSKTLETLTMLNMDIELLTGRHPSEWKRSSSYREMKMKVDAIKVVNDTGERAIALMSSVNGFLTKNENELQDILQVIENQRKKHSNINKDKFINNDEE